MAIGGIGVSVNKNNCIVYPLAHGGQDKMDTILYMFSS